MTIQSARISTRARQKTGWIVEPITLGQARSLIERGHYIGHLRKSGIKLGLFTDNILAGAAVFGQPSREGVAKSLGGDLKTVIELVRFYTVPELDSTTWGTWFLSRAVKRLPEQYEIVVAYSDPNAGHYGGLYQAASWLYLGRTTGEPYWYQDILGNHIGKQTPWKIAQREGLLFGERAVDGERRAAYERGWKRISGEVKYRYVYPRNRRARRRLEPMAEPYPKPTLTT